LNKKEQSSDYNPEMNQMSELSNKDFKTTIIKMLQQIISNSVHTHMDSLTKK
jgi:hypothetical protein